MVRRLAPLAALALPLAACGQPASPNEAVEANAAAPAEAASTNYVEQIRTMPEPLRHATFLRAIRDAGQPCQNVVSSQEGEPVEGNPAWGVRCEDGSGWQISIAPNGDARVTGPVPPS